MAFKRVGDVMIPLDEYPHLPHWFTLRQALELEPKFEPSLKLMETLAGVSSAPK